MAEHDSFCNWNSTRSLSHCHRCLSSIVDINVKIIIVNYITDSLGFINISFKYRNTLCVVTSLTITRDCNSNNFKSRNLARPKPCGTQFPLCSL